MKPEKSNGVNRPFEQLKGLLKQKSVNLPETKYDRTGPVPPAPKEPACPELETALFMAEMADVDPLCRSDRISDDPEPAPVEPPPPRDEEREAMLRLKELVDFGCGFRVRDTPEYMEGVGPNVHPDVCEKLHDGKYAIQSHVDLHGLTAVQAGEVFEGFMKRAVQSGHRGVQIVHGRGLSSPAEPVLKKCVLQWLTCGPWRKWVLAFASSKGCDGGAGATYVLLRRQPLTRSQMKTKKRKKPVV